MILKYHKLWPQLKVICYHLQPSTAKHKSKVCPSTKTARWVQLSEPPRGAILFSTGGRGRVSKEERGHSQAGQGQRQPIREYWVGASGNRSAPFGNWVALLSRYWKYVP